GRYGAIFGITNNAWSYYNALQTLWSKRLSQGLSTQLSYTWSKNIDTGSEATFVGAGDTNFLISDLQGARGNRGPSRLDQPERRQRPESQLSVPTGNRSFRLARPQHVPFARAEKLRHRIRQEHEAVRKGSRPRAAIPRRDV